MAGGLLALLDDTAVMSKVAAKKTAALLGDDLAVNAEKIKGGGVHLMNRCAFRQHSLTALCLFWSFNINLFNEY